MTETIAPKAEARPSLPTSPPYERPQILRKRAVADATLQTAMSGGGGAGGTVNPNDRTGPFGGLGG
jgi:hypothetical protein